jgi:hypothetical protein
MGVALGLVFDKQLPEALEFSEFTDGKALAASIPILDDICQERELVPFSTFAPDFEELEEQMSLEELCAKDLYHSCATAGRIIRELLTVLKTKRRWAKELGKARTRCVIACLEELERLLNIGKKKRAKFYLLYY